MSIVSEESEVRDVTPEQQKRLESAYKKLSRDTGRVTVTALRAEAGLSQNVVSAWLRALREREQQQAERAAREAEPAVPEALAAAALAAQTQIITEAWHQALAAAHAELADRHASELAEARLAEHEAIERAAAADKLVAALRTKNTDLADTLAAAEASLTDLRATQKHHRDTAAAAEARTVAAQAEAAELRGELTGLRAALAALNTETKP